jgi:hypothetical protein
VIERPYSLTPLLTGLPAWQGPTPVEQVPPTGRSAGQPQRPSPTAWDEAQVARAALALGQRGQPEAGAAGADPALGYRARYAVHAYASLQDGAQRDYLSRLLGVDEYA